MSSAYVPLLSFLGGASGALITAFVAFRLERSRMAASVQARWDEQLLEKSADLVKAARTLQHLAQRYDRSADQEAQDARIDEAHQTLRVLSEQLRIVGTPRVQSAASFVSHHAYAVRVQGEDGHDPRATDYPGTTPVERLSNALHDFYAAVRVQLRAPDAETVLRGARASTGLEPLPVELQSRSSRRVPRAREQ